jgi:pimeloyl-ACP methyl ester carboxylesterase
VPTALDRPVFTVTRETITVDGARIQYQRGGSGPALIFIHGLVGCSRNWDRNLPALAPFRTVYAPDLVNNGASERVRGIDPGVDAQVDRLIRWMDSAGISSADIVAHSHGGVISMRLAARHPERVRRMALFAPANPFCTLGQGQIRFYNTWFGGVFARRIIPLLPRILYRRSLERIYGDPTLIDEAIFRGYTDGLDSANIAHIVDVMRGWASDMALLEASFPALRQSPPLLLWGDRDRAVGLESGRRLAELLGGPLTVIPGAGHVAFEERPDLSNRALIDWFLRT